MKGNKFNPTYGLVEKSLLSVVFYFYVIVRFNIRFGQERRLPGNKNNLSEYNLIMVPQS